jgi:hypothetical protein
VGAVEGFEGAAGPADKAGSSAAAGGHGSGVEDSSGVAAIEDLMKAFDDGFK